jgi:hypothetical protein
MANSKDVVVTGVSVGIGWGTTKVGLCFDGALRFVASYWLWWQDLQTGVSVARVKEVTGRLFGATYDPPENVWLTVKFSPAAAGQADGSS